MVTDHGELPLIVMSKFEYVVVHPPGVLRAQLVIEHPIGKRFEKYVGVTV